jgi:hypothetical protein
MGGFNFIVDRDQQPLNVHWVRPNIDLANSDARLPHGQRLLDIVDCQTGGGRIIWGKDKLVDLAAKVRAHDPLALWGKQYHDDRLLNIGRMARKRKAPPSIEANWEGPADAKKITQYNLILSRRLSPDHNGRHSRPGNRPTMGSLIAKTSRRLTTDQHRRAPFDNS